jgi:hypothetical protein
LGRDSQQQRQRQRQHQVLEDPPSEAECRLAYVSTTGLLSHIISAQTVTVALMTNAVQTTAALAGICPRSQNAT